MRRISLTARAALFLAVLCLVLAPCESSARFRPAETQVPGPCLAAKGEDMRDVKTVLREALQGETRVTLARALELADEPDSETARRLVAEALTALGFERKRVRIDGERAYAYERAEATEPSPKPIEQTGGDRGGQIEQTGGDSNPRGGDKGRDSTKSAVISREGQRGGQGGTGGDSETAADYWARVEERIAKLKAEQKIADLPAPSPRTVPPSKPLALVARPVDPIGEAGDYGERPEVEAPAKRPKCAACGSRRYLLSVSGACLAAKPCECVSGPCKVPACKDGWVYSGQWSRRCPGCAPLDVAKRISAAKIPARYLGHFQGAPRPDGYKVTPAQGEARKRSEAWCRALPAPSVLRQKGAAAIVGLCAWGGYGSGKTALFCRALRWAAERGYQVLFADWGATLADVKESYTEDSPSPLIPLERAEILLIDDVSAPATPWQAKQLAQVIRNRYNAARPTLYTSNLAPSELQAALLPEVWSRLLETTEFIECTGDDLRVAIGANRR